MNKLIVSVIVLALMGFAAFSYFTRPVAAPSEVTDTASSTDVAIGITDTASSTGNVKNYSIASGSVVEFNIFEVLNGKDFTVIGTTSAVTGTIAYNPEEPEKTVIGPIKINARTLKTESSRRDGVIARAILKSETAENEFIVFTPTKLSDVKSSRTEGNNAYTANVTGDLTIAGVTKPVTFAIRATQASAGFYVTGETKINKSDFNISVPSVPFVAKVGEEVTLKIMANVK